MLLNSEQKKASEIDKNSLLVLAGPGTGKTTALVARYVHLVNTGVKPENILCFAFARKASEEIKLRIEKEINVNTKFLPIGTFHSIGNKAIREFGNLVGLRIPENILSSDYERLKIIRDLREILKDDYEKVKDDDDKSPLAILQYIDNVRRQLIDPEDASVIAAQNGNWSEMVHSNVYSLYEKHLTDNNLIDFERMIQWSCKVLKADADNEKSFISKFSHILIDEYQDINLAQKTMVDYLLKANSKLWVVGDDDQAIYGWRGSSVNFILDFEKNYIGSSKIYLSKNYRSGSKIVNAANRLAKHFYHRHEKNIVSARDSEGKVELINLSKEEFEVLEVVDSIKERNKKGVEFKDIAVIARTNFLPTSIIAKLISSGIPVAVRDGVKLFKDPVAQDLLIAVAISSNVKPEKGWNRKISPNVASFSKKIKDEPWTTKVKALATLLEKWSPKTLSDEELLQRIEVLNNYRDYLLQFKNADDIFPRIRNAQLISESSNSVHVGTIHGAKGLEWDTVHVIGWEDNLMPHERNSYLKSKMDEERRLAYVALTRAKNYLKLYYVDQRSGKHNSPSRFLSEIFKSKNQNKVKESVSSKKNGDEYADINKALNESEEKRKNLQKIDNINNSISNRIADGMGESSQQLFIAGEGLLSHAGYNVQKNGPSRKQRQDLLFDIFNGVVTLPDTLSQSVVEQWGDPNSLERLKKIRNTINTSLGMQKGRSNTSPQAVKKWEEDLHFIDNDLIKNLEN